MPRPRLSLPLALLLLHGCTTILVVGDREDAAVTPDQPITLDLGDPSRDGGLSVADGDGATVDAARECRDNDGDRYGVGLGCINVDCDDTDAAITDQCYCDRVPNVRGGCPCTPGDAPLGCDLDTGLSRGAENACRLGQRTCDPVPGAPETGRWSECRRWRPDFNAPTPFVGVVSACPGSCLAGCHHQVVCPEVGDAIPAGSSNVALGSAAHAVFCPGGAGLRGGVTTSCTTPDASTPCVGVYRRVYEASICAAGTVPFWGQFNFSSTVPDGARIAFRVRVAETSAALSTAAWSDPLFTAPGGSPSMPTSVDLGALIRVAMPRPAGTDRLPFLELEATLTPAPDGRAPTLVSTEIQFTCADPGDPQCREGGECLGTGGPCRRARIQCLNTAAGRIIEVCADEGAQPAGTVCGMGSVCSAAGACVPCVEGAACDTGRPCRAGRLSCATGAPTCVPGAMAAAGVVCRPATGVCDLAETCDGVRDTCPTDAFVVSSVVCRASAGVCDPQETCTGFSGACPANVFVAAGTVCRAAAGVCDVRETCTGSSAACPADGFIVSGTVCAAGTGACAARSCTGASAACPAGSGTAEVCDNVDNDCDGRVDEDVARSCYSGPTGTMDVGVCRAGRQTCTAGAWGGCAGEVLPTPEVCDALDNDCNGALNNGVPCP